MNIGDIRTIIMKDENRVLEQKKVTRKLVEKIQTLCAFLHSNCIILKLKILGRNVINCTQRGITRKMTKISSEYNSCRYLNIWMWH